VDLPLTSALTRAAAFAAQDDAAWHAVSAAAAGHASSARGERAVLLIESPAQLKAFAHGFKPDSRAADQGIGAIHVFYADCRSQEAHALAELAGVPVTVCGHVEDYLPPAPRAAGPLDLLRYNVVLAHLGVLGMQPPPPLCVAASPRRYENAGFMVRGLVPPTPQGGVAPPVREAAVPKQRRGYDSRGSAARAERAARGVTDSERQAWLATALAYYDREEACPHSRGESDHQILSQYLRYFEDTPTIRAVRAELEANKGFPPPEEIWLDLADFLDYMATPRSLDTTEFFAEHGVRLRESMTHSQAHTMGQFHMWYDIMEGEPPSDHDAGAWLRGGASG
jgi:hypothetical protein